MNRMPHSHLRQYGLSLIELLVSIALTMVLVTAAAFVYLNTRETQAAIDSSSASQETGAFALQLIGRNIMNAGFYPTTMPGIPASSPALRRVQSYPPIRNASSPASSPEAAAADWNAPADVYNDPIFGCEGARFDHQTASCPAPTASAPDSIVVNYFTSESVSMGAVAGQRRDCTGADVAPVDLTRGDPSNRVRRMNTPASAPATVDPGLPPQQPVFVSNRYALTNTIQLQNGQNIATRSLACGGNGRSPFGVVDSAAYQPLLSGLEDLQFTYGVFNTGDTRAPERFYNATEVTALGNRTIDGVSLRPWQRVVAVRVCLITKTLPGTGKIADKTDQLRTYTDCNNAIVTPSANDPAIYKRYVQVFALRNRLNQGY